MKSEVDIRDFDARFHGRSMFPRIVLKSPFGLPFWGKQEQKTIVEYLLKSGANVREEVVTTVEKKIAGMFNVKHAIALGSGREAIYLGLQSLGLKPGDGVILPDYCCQSVLAPVLSLGLKPVFADVDERLQIDSQSVARVVRPWVKVIIIPHLYGRLADMDRLTGIARNHGLHIIDDAAQAIGMRHSSGFAGTCGDFGIFSFGLFKPLSAMGGGMLLTNNNALYLKAAQLMKSAPRMNHSRWEVFKIWAKIFNRRWTYGLFLLNRMHRRAPNRALNHTQQPMRPRKMAVLDAQLIDTMLDRLFLLRSKLAEPAGTMLHRLSFLPWLQQETDSDYIGYPRWQIRLRDEDYSSDNFINLFACLLRRGIEVQAGYRPLHQIMSERSMAVEGEFENSRILHNRVLCLPFSPKGKIDYLLRTLQQYSPRLNS